jgi:hypothetical protein
MIKVLHLSFHLGCHNELLAISKELDFELSFLEFSDGTPNKYNIGHDRAEKYWNKHKDYFNNFDLIITSDTAPISRVFLQNNWNKKLIIWINNRFDYFDAATLDCDFPDDEYYQLIKNAISNENVKIFGYTPFENFYCKNIRNIDIGNLVIQPTGMLSNVYKNNKLSNIENIEDTFFVGPYHNDNIMMNLKEKIESLDFNVHNGRFNGPYDLARFKGVIHIPYAWSNYSFFEALFLGIIYFIPSKEFLFKLKKDKDFFWSPPYKDENIELSEWYNSKHKNLLIYFDSWLDLKVKMYTTNYKKQKDIIKKFSFDHINEMLDLWRNVLEI